MLGNRVELVMKQTDNFVENQRGDKTFEDKGGV
jgi:hypothetical protein